MRPGDVFLYNYLWAHEAERGEESGRKTRRACLLVRHADTLYLFPLSSKAPIETDRDRIFLAVPEQECLRIGLPPGSISHLILDDFNKVHLSRLHDFESLNPVGRLSQPFLAKAANVFLSAVRTQRVGGRDRS